jgi:hypothetical protein
MPADRAAPRLWGVYRAHQCDQVWLIGVYLARCPYGA